MSRKTLIASLATGAVLLAGLTACSSDSASDGAAGNGAGSFGDCPISGEAGDIKLETAKEGVLTVATVLPNNGWWNGDSPQNINGGFEYCLSANIAHRAGLDKMEVQNQSWDQFISGSKTDYDWGMASVTITPEREKVFDFSDPYFSSNLGIAIKKDADVTEENIKEKKIGVLQGNMGAQFSQDTLKPAGGVQLFQSETEMFTALNAGQVDAVITDTTLALTNTSTSNGALEVVAQYELDQGYGIVFQKGSPNVDAVNKVIAEIQQDGTLDKISEQYLKPLFGTDPTKLPIWKLQ